MCLFYLFYVFLCVYHYFINYICSMLEAFRPFVVQ